MSVFEHGWYCQILRDRFDNVIKKPEWLIACQQINEFERWLTDDGQLILKFWMHISRRKQKQRFKKYLADPDEAWRVTKDYRRQHRNYEKWLPAVDEMLARTETSNAPWTVVEANDQRWALVRIFEVLAQRMEQELDKRSQQTVSSQPAETIKKVQKTTPKKRTGKRSQVNGRHREPMEVAGA